MPMPSSGTITMGQVRTELGSSGSLTLNDSNVRNLADKTGSGTTIALADFYGKARITIALSSLTGTNSSQIREAHLILGGTTTPTTSGHGWVSGGTGISVTRVNNTTFRFNGGTDTRNQYTRTGTYRIRAVSGTTTRTLDVAVTVITTYSGSTCFHGDCMVLMEGGSQKKLKDVTFGDWVMTANGAAEVVELEQPTLGERDLLVFNGGRCIASAEHSIWTRHPGSGQQWWMTRDMKGWLREADLGVGPWFKGRPPFNLTNQVGRQWDIATVNGFEQMTWEKIPGDPDMVLYHLGLSRGGSYFVDGVLVSSHADKSEVDWENFNWTGLNP